MQPVGTRRVIEAYEVLFHAGDDSDMVYFVDDGALEVVHNSEGAHSGDPVDVVVGTLGVGEVVGEITAVIGGRRTATVRAGERPVTLREMTADQYGQWLAERPEEARRIAEQARDRIDHTRVARVLTELVGPGHGNVIDDVNEMLEWTRLEAGDQLFVQGDIADAAYILLTGRLQLTAVHDGSTTLDVSIGRGDIVGELGIIEQAPRSASATATRDCTLARLSEEAFEVLTAKHPKLMLQIFRKILTRVMRPQHRTPHAGMIAVAVLSDHVSPNFVREISAEVERHGPTLYLDREQVNRFFNRRGVVDAGVGTAGHAQLDEFLSEADVAHRWVVLETDRELTTWTSRSLRSADRVLLVTSAFPDERERHLIKEFAAVLDGIVDRELWVVQSNASTINRPVANQSVQDAAQPDRLLQHHRNNAASTARIARLASGTATGIALSGGGGRAFAQIGALRALDEAGIPIDVVSGTSMGSVVASSIALLADPEAVLPHLVNGFAGTTIIDYTLPMVSFASGNGLMAAIDETCGPIRIEDLALPFTCLSTNLTNAALVEHRSGPVAHALRASVSIPGVFPPVIVNGELLVDGGIMENLPVGPLVRDPAVNTIFAIDVAPPDGPRSAVVHSTGVRGREALLGQLSKTRAGYPAMTNIVMASMLLSSTRARNDAIEHDQIDHYLSLHLKGVRLLDFDEIESVATRGYEATVAYLESNADL